MVFHAVLADRLKLVILYSEELFFYEDHYECLRAVLKSPM